MLAEDPKPPKTSLVMSVCKFPSPETKIAIASPLASPKASTPTTWVATIALPTCDFKATPLVSLKVAAEVTKVIAAIGSPLFIPIP